MSDLFATARQHHYLSGSEPTAAKAGPAAGGRARAAQCLSILACPLQKRSTTEPQRPFPQCGVNGSAKTRPCFDFCGFAHPKGRDDVCLLSDKASIRILNERSRKSRRSSDRTTYNLARELRVVVSCQRSLRKSMKLLYTLWQI